MIKELLLFIPFTIFLVLGLWFSMANYQSCEKVSVTEYISTSGSDGLFSSPVNTYKVSDGNIKQSSMVLKIGHELCK